MNMVIIQDIECLAQKICKLKNINISNSISILQNQLRGIIIDYSYNFDISYM